MCAQYDVLKTHSEIAQAMRRSFSGPAEWKPRIVPHALAPVAVGDHLELMRFSLLPRWSREPKVKFATYNARLDTALEKPTWKEPFLRRHCIVPISRFLEPVYQSRKGLEGNMVAFTAPELLLAAGIWDEWSDGKAAEALRIRSFALLTDGPSDFVADVGHDRQPVFLSPERAEEWLANEGEKGEGLRTFLKEMAEEPDFRVEIDRPLARGWEKRAEVITIKSNNSNSLKI